MGPRRRHGVGMLAEMLAAGLNANLAGRDHMPIEVERQIVAWMRQMFGFPDTASGIFVTGTSMANLMADAGGAFGATRPVRAPARLAGSTAPVLIAYTSVATHGCICTGDGPCRLRHRRAAADSG